ncbi:MAG: hypothetical protein AAF378_24610 [Cyanobacteria bacterium P01_A01_bin.84]
MAIRIEIGRFENVFQTISQRHFMVDTPFSNKYLVLKFLTDWIDDADNIESDEVFRFKSYETFLPNEHILIQGSDSEIIAELEKRLYLCFYTISREVEGNYRLVTIGNRVYSFLPPYTQWELKMYNRLSLLDEMGEYTEADNLTTIIR